MGSIPETLIEIATWTVFLSVIAHGVTAGPLAIRYGKSVADEPIKQLEVGAHLGDPVPAHAHESASPWSARSRIGSVWLTHSIAIALMRRCWVLFHSFE